MQEILMGVNWTAVIVGAVAAYALGWAWYSPQMFGKQWQKAVGISAKDKTPMGHAMSAQAIATFLLAWAVGVTEVSNNLWLAILIAVTMAAVVKANGLFAKKKKVAIWVEVSYIMVMVLVMILAQGIF